MDPDQDQGNAHADVAAKSAHDPWDEQVASMRTATVMRRAIIIAVAVLMLPAASVWWAWSRHDRRQETANTILAVQNFLRDTVVHAQTSEDCIFYPPYCRKAGPSPIPSLQGLVDFGLASSDAWGRPLRSLCQARLLLCIYSVGSNGLDEQGAGDDVVNCRTERPLDIE